MDSGVYTSLHRFGGSGLGVWVYTSMIGEIGLAACRFKQEQKDASSPFKALSTGARK